MDALSDIIRLLDFRAGVYFHSTLCGSWNLKSSENYMATYHFISHGSCLLNIPEPEKELLLHAGDLVLLPQNVPHTMQALTSEEQPNNDESATGLICGFFDFQQQLRNPVLDALPVYMHIRQTELQQSSRFDDLLKLMFYETDSSQPGVDLIVDNLSEILFIYAIRSYMNRHQIENGFLSLLMDQKLQSVIKAIHQYPGQAWSVASIAEAVGMSRSSLAAYFQKKSGLTPMQYVTGYRMHFAYQALKNSEQSVAQVAEQTGYATEVSFRKAFKNYFGVGPGAVRKSHS